ncbi:MULTISPECIES: AraC family transcriptional regulator [Bradyrhizobium]|uniref:AraC family transcriptional regulator n=1 Tax=Bradyrhizobium elkanii TaxID=29448 RepID=A0A4V6CZ72_BRAEL|nr:MULTISPECIES: AraC family transcriptional regulator [Bradyrhizobium]MTV11813.1 AraC family transcriptional regulator [Bradyrhizobium sp. BR2003]TKV73645.1 AraC family transcriptional regulator [Bradyrhizobium elkanii]
MTALRFESPLDRATFRSSRMFGGIDVMSARFVRHSFAPHSHDELMIGVMHAGVKSFRCGNTRETAAPGNLVVVNPGEMHTGERKQGRELVYAALYVSESALAAMLPRSRADWFVIRQTVIDDRDIWPCLDAAQRLAIAGDDAAATEEAMTCGVSLLFERFGTSKLVHSEADCPRAVDRAVEFLQARACDHISLEDASKASGVGSFHLIRLFQKHVGLTPYAYLTQVRIEKSRKLLRLGEPVAQVALDVGFADQAHFTKRFKQLTGTTPALYARSMQ